MARGGMMGAGWGLRQDASVLKESLKPGTTMRVMRFATAYGAEIVHQEVPRHRKTYRLDCGTTQITDS